MIDDFTFNLVRADREQYTYHYIVSSEDFNMMVGIYGIDTTKQCGPLSNIDFVHFVWENFLHFSYKNMQWLSHLAARLSFQNCCVLNIIELKVEVGKTMQTVMIVLSVTLIF